MNRFTRYFSLLRAWCCLAVLASGIVFQAAADELREDRVTVRYEPADEAVARRTLKVAVEAIEEYEERLPVGSQPITIAICHTHGDFRRYAGTLALPGVVGVAEGGSGVLAVKAPGIQPPGADYEGILRHELIHLLLARNYNTATMPRWLNEGLAMILSGERRVDERFLAGYMYVRGRLIPYAELPIVLEAYEYDGRLGEAYAQSLSMTEFLMKRLGEERFWSLLRDLDHRPFPESLEALGGMTAAEFDKAWRQSLWKVALVFSLVSGFSAFQLMILLTMLAYWRLRRRNRAQLQRWQEEEEEESFMFAHELEGREEPYPWEEEDEDRL